MVGLATCVNGLDRRPVAEIRILCSSDPSGGGQVVDTELMIFLL